MRTEVLEQIRDLPALEWDRLVGTGDPFLRHAFLDALESSQSVCEQTGWLPQHLVLYEGDTVVAAMPLYLKFHSYGEYVFDWSWANAHERAGIPYYPKLICMVPFTPVTGQRLLVADTDRAPALGRALATAALELARERDVSSLHYLFVTARDRQILEQLGMLTRTGTQFHWCNNGYRNFDDYLAAFSSAKRKKIRQERRKVHQAGLGFEILRGDEIQSRHWDRFYHFYRTTSQRYGAIAYLSRGFFDQLSARMSEQALLIFATNGSEYVAGAYFLMGPDGLYGRYWGCDGFYSGLHFETCYYQPIEYCINHGLARFEAGAQGEHKLSRGLLPVTTHSAHWLQRPEFAQAVKQYLERESHSVQHYIEALRAHTPFRQSDS